MAKERDIMLFQKEKIEVIGGVWRHFPRSICFLLCGAAAGD